MILKNRSKAKNSTGRYSWYAISNIMRNANGEEFTYDQFIDTFELNPSLQNLVADYDEYGVTLITQPEKPEEVPAGAEADINNSAKAAASKTLDRNRG